MLQKIYIQNFALLEKQEIEFAPGLNILTGETGAGKSLVINALNSILGEKISLDILPNQKDKAVVEGIFTNWPEEVTNLLKVNELELFPDELLLRRELNRSGRSRSFINDSLTQAEVLKKISGLLVDLHGQHEHQSLLHEENHVTFLDNFGGLLSLTETVAELFHKYWDIQHQLQKLKNYSRELNEKKDFLEFQIKEIESLNLDPKEEEELLQEERILENYEKLIGGCQSIFSALYDDEASVYSRLGIVIAQMEELSSVDPVFGEVAQQLQEAYIQVEDAAHFAQDYASRSDFDPQRLEEIRLRLSQIARIKKKYGLPIEEILARYEKYKDELAQLENVDAEIAALREQRQIQIQRLREKCEELSEKRKAVAKEFSKAIATVLHQIGMPQARFNVHFEPYGETEGGIKLGDGLLAKQNGIDRVAFYVATNPGAAPKQLVKIASGGELSRIMLAIKSVMAEKDQIGVLVFDEIDIGISGRIAEAVGRQLKQLSKSHQIICVTHLPQIAGFADRHFSVRKVIRNGKATTIIQPLNRDERIQEIAYLLGGEKITEAVLKNAESMLSASEREIK